MSSLNEAEDADVAVPAWRDRTLPALRVLPAIGWTSFAIAVATDGFARAPAPHDWPLLIPKLPMPPTLPPAPWLVLQTSALTDHAHFHPRPATLTGENLTPTHHTPPN